MSTTTPTTTPATARKPRGKRVTDPAAAAAATAALTAVKPVSFDLPADAAAMVARAIDPTTDRAALSAELAVRESVTARDAVTRMLTDWFVLGAIVHGQYRALSSAPADDVVWAGVKAVVFPTGSTTLFGRSYDTCQRGWQCYTYVTNDRMARRDVLSEGLTADDRKTMSAHYGVGAKPIVAWCTADATGRVMAAATVTADDGTKRVRPAGFIMAGSNRAGTGATSRSVVDDAAKRATAAATAAADAYDRTMVLVNTARAGAKRPTRATTIPDIGTWGDLRSHDASEVIRWINLLGADLIARGGVAGYDEPTDPRKTDDA